MDDEEREWGRESNITSENRTKGEKKTKKRTKRSKKKGVKRGMIKRIRGIKTNEMD